MSADRKLMAVPITRSFADRIDIGPPAALFAARVISVGLGRQHGIRSQRTVNTSG